MKIKLELYLNTVNIILASLSKQPYETVAELIQEVRNQALSQTNPQKEEEQSKSA